MSPAGKGPARTEVAEPSAGEVEPAAQISLVDLLDRLLGAGVVLSGDVVISLAGVDLVQVKLHALVTTIREDMDTPW